MSRIMQLLQRIVETSSTGPASEYARALQEGRAYLAEHGIYARRSGEMPTITRNAILTAEMRIDPAGRDEALASLR